jgi:hypothetical protein
MLDNMSTDARLAVTLQEYNSKTGRTVGELAVVAKPMASQVVYSDGSTESQLVPSALNPVAFKIPGRAKGMHLFGFSFDGAVVPAELQRFNTKRCVVRVRMEDGAGNVLDTWPPLWDWKCDVDCDGCIVQCATNDWVTAPPLC